MRFRPIATIVSRFVYKPTPRPYHLADELLAATQDCLRYMLRDRGDATFPAGISLRKTVHEQDLDISELGLRECIDTLEYVIGKLKAHISAPKVTEQK